MEGEPLGTYKETIEKPQTGLDYPILDTMVKSQLIAIR